MSRDEANRPSVALLTNAPSPYGVPCLNELSKHCRLLVLFDTAREPDREWVIDERRFEFQSAYTRGLLIPRRRSRHGVAQRMVLHVPLNVVPILNRFQPDVVVSDELGARTASAAFFCGLRKRPLITWWAGTPHSENWRSRPRTALREMLLRRAARAWVYGKEGERSLVAYGVPESRIDTGLAGTDTADWRRKVDEARRATRSAVREHLGLRGAVLLFAGNLTLRKGIGELLAALSLLATDHDLPEWSALFVGSGPLAGDVSRWSERHPTVPVAATGYVQPSELATYFSAADLLVMPSRDDTWGYVCLEALVAGLPQVTSMFAGAAADLVTSSEIGSVVDPRDSSSLAGHLADRIRGGPRPVPEAPRVRAMNAWSPTAFAERAMASIRSSLDSRSP